MGNKIKINKGIFLHISVSMLLFTSMVLMDSIIFDKIVKDEFITYALFELLLNGILMIINIKEGFFHKKVKI